MGKSGIMTAFRAAVDEFALANKIPPPYVAVHKGKIYIDINSISSYILGDAAMQHK